MFLRCWYPVNKTNIQVFLTLNRLFNHPVVYSKKLRTEIQAKFSYRKIYKQFTNIVLKIPHKLWQFSIHLQVKTLIKVGVSALLT